MVRRCRTHSVGLSRRVNLLKGIGSAWKEVITNDLPYECARPQEVVP